MKLNIGENIRRLRREANLTQEELGRELDVSPQAISRWENGSAYPDIEFLPTLAKYFGKTVDELMGYGADGGKAHVKTLLNALNDEGSRETPDVERFIAIIREMRRDYLFDFNEDFWRAVSAFHRLPGVLPELRKTAEAILAKCTDMRQREDAIYYMAMYEDDEHIDEFLNATSSRRDLSYRNLCFERAEWRGEKDKYEEMLQIKLCFTITDLLGNFFYTENTNRVLSAEEHLRVNTFQLNILNWLSGVTPTEEHPVFCDCVLDEWSADRIVLGLDRTGYLASVGDTEGAFTVLEDTVSMLEKIVKQFAETDTGKMEIKGRCSWVDKVKFTLHRFDHAEEDTYYLAVMWEVGEYHYLIGHVGPQGVLFSLTTDRKDHKWLDPIRNDPRYQTYVNRVQALM